LEEARYMPSIDSFSVTESFVVRLITSAPIVQNPFIVSLLLFSEPGNVPCVRLF
jgi:hypothetical protein